MDREVALDTLKAALDAGSVPEKDKNFVSSLIEQSGKRGLSVNQWYWVTRLAVAMSMAPTTVADFSRVYAMFNKAQEHLKYPKVILTTESGLCLKLYVSTVRSRVPDTVNVVDDLTGRWHGRIYRDGRWEGGEGSDEVKAVLTELADNPEKVAAEHGKLTGRCCFCNRSLSDDRSTDVGYGPVCATRFGLDWGKK